MPAAPPATAAAPRSVAATYDGAAFVPDQPLDLPAGTSVTIPLPPAGAEPIRVDWSEAPWETVGEAIDESRRRPEYFRRRYGWDITNRSDTGQHGKPLGDVNDFPDFPILPSEEGRATGEPDAADL